MKQSKSSREKGLPPEESIPPDAYQTENMAAAESTEAVDDLWPLEDVTEA